MRMVGKIKNVNLIRKIAWSFHKTTGIEWEELFAEALLQYVELLKNNNLEENTDKGKISTFIWTSICNRLKNYIKRYGRVNQPLKYSENMDENCYEPVTPFWEHLTPGANLVANFVLKNPERFICLSPEKAKQQIQNELTGMGWSREKIDAGILDLSEACSV